MTQWWRGGRLVDHRGRVTQWWRGGCLVDHMGGLTQCWRDGRLVDHRGAGRWRGGRLVEHYEHSSFFFSAVATEKNMVVTKDDGEWYETVVSVVSATW